MAGNEGRVFPVGPGPGGPEPLTRAAIVALTFCTFGVMADEPPEERQVELVRMLRHDCGACHGLRLDGGLGPPLTPETLAGVAPAVLEQVVLEGRRGTPMPPWKALLSPGEARWMVRAMQTGGIDE